jgi:hypothetical protein
MTLNCDLGIDEARELFAKEQNEETTKDLIDSAVEYWKCDLLTDAGLAADLRLALEYLERAGTVLEESNDLALATVQTVRLADGREIIRRLPVPKKFPNGPGDTR